MFPQYIPDCLSGDWTGDDSVNVSGSLSGICSLASDDLPEDGVCSSDRELGRTTKGRGLSIREKGFEYPGDSGLANTSLRGNMTSGVSMGGKGKDVFLLSRGDGSHTSSGGNRYASTAYI
jgi:hypothetical protein